MVLVLISYTRKDVRILVVEVDSISTAAVLNIWILTIQNMRRRKMISLGTLCCTNMMLNRYWSIWKHRHRLKVNLSRRVLSSNDMSRIRSFMTKVNINFYYYLLRVKSFVVKDVFSWNENTLKLRLLYDIRFLWGCLWNRKVPVIEGLLMFWIPS